MMKFWKIKDSKVNRLILIKDKSIYKGNPSLEDLDKFSSEMNEIPFENKLFSIPYSYISMIENQKGKQEIKIYYGNDSEEELKIENEMTKKEVFDYLKQDLIGFNYSSILPGVFKYAKAQFFALILITAVFLVACYYAIQLNNGVEYEVVGRPGLYAFVFGLAHFGIAKLTLAYSLLLGLMLFALKRRLGSRSEIEVLKR